MKQNHVTPEAAVETPLERIEDKLAALARMDVLKRELIPGGASRVITLHRELLGLADQVATLPDDPAYADRKADMESQLQRLKADLAAAELDRNQLGAELKHIESEIIPGCYQTTMLSDILPYQHDLREMRANVARLEEAIRAQEAIIQAARDTIVPEQDRRNERAEILARLAIGEANGQELDALDEDISKTHYDHLNSLDGAKPVIERATMTISGLNNKIADLRADIAGLEQKVPLLLEQYLTSEIREVCARYVVHAQEAHKCYVRVVALERVLKRATGQITGGIMMKPLVLPCPQLSGFKAFAAKNDSRLIFDAGSAFAPSSIYETAASEEIARLQGAGCDLVK